MEKAPVIILINFFIGGFFSPILAQTFTVDSSKKAMDVWGSFNGAEIHLPGVKSHPEYPGGIKAWHDFLRSNINILVPFANNAIPGTYNVMVRFLVGSDGKVYAIRADSSCGYGMESEVIRCVQKSSLWKPAETSSGKKVSFMLRLFVNFTVSHNNVIVSFK